MTQHFDIYSPKFGGGRKADFYIRNKSNVQKSWGNIGNTYENKNFKSGSK